MNIKNQYYFSQRLQSVMEEIPLFGLTVIVAPSGFGKTTALREYLAEEHKSAVVRWYTCLGESTGKAWKGICSLFQGQEDSIADELLELGEPNTENLADIARLISGFTCSKPTFLVIDNYQLFESPVRKRCIAAFSVCRDKNLHIIIGTQPLKNEGNGPTFHSHPYLRITARDLFFDNDCIAGYCRLRGLDIDQEQINIVQNTAKGWVAAVRLQLRHYEDTGNLIDFNKIRPLVEIAIWNRLSGEERQLMMGLALLESFNTRQAAIMSDSTTMPETVAELLSLDFFVRHVADRQAYVLHGILRDYLLERFALEPDSFRNSMYRKAAQASLDVNDLFQAALFFLEVEDYEAILSLPMSTQYFYNNQERNITKLFEKLIDRCPQDILKRYPVFLVLMAYNFFRKGDQSYFLRVTDFLGELLNGEDTQNLELARARGEYAMLMSFTEYNDIARMGAYHNKALQHLRVVSDHPRSEVFQGTMPFGTASVLCLYWNRLGGLSQLLDLMDTYLPVYSSLASGHGAGVEHIFRAEAALACGDDKSAELMAHKAIYRARSSSQYAVCLSADLILAEIALLRGDAEAYEAARNSMAHNAEESRQRSILRLGELCQASLDLSLGEISDIPTWLRDTAGIQNVVYAHSMPYAYIFYEHYLLLKGHHKELYGLSEHIMQQSSTMNYLLPQLYHFLYMSIAKLKDGKKRQAHDNLKEALRLALPDKMYLPFARLAPGLAPLLTSSLQNAGQAQALADLKALCSRRERGIRCIQQSIGESPLLTPREREVSSLARNRLSAKEIAAHLCISVHTVNTILKSVYRKLNISGKFELSKIRNF